MAGGGAMVGGRFTFNLQKDVSLYRMVATGVLISYPSHIGHRTDNPPAVPEPVGAQALFQPRAHVCPDYMGLVFSL